MWPMLATVALLALPMNIATAQELDTNTLQQETEAAEKARAQKPAAQQQQHQPQQQPSQPQQTQGSQTATAANQQASPSAAGTVAIPAGTKLQLGLVRPLSVKKTNPGDSAYLQVTFPVSVGNEMVVPPGTYLQGVIGKIIRRDRTRALLEFELSSASLIYSTGYTVNFPGPLNAAPVIAQLTPPGVGQPQNVPQVGAMSATGATPAPLPAPSLGDAPRNAMIALGVAGAAGIVLMAVAANHSDVLMEVGTPMQIVLPAPLEVERERVVAAVQQYSTQATSNPPAIVQPPQKPKMCYDPGSPGTPDTVIPGSPGTPPTVIPGGPGMPDTVIPGTPGTPDTIIPGTPGTPGRYYPCK